MGPFITFEGPEGSGKSTHIRLLAEQLRARGREVLVTREPGGTPLCEAIRGLLQHDTADESPTPRAEALLFFASRAQLVETTIRPALRRGVWVLCDRYADSTFAYQGHGRGFPLDALQAINAFATGALVPDLTLLLDIDAAASRQRLAARQAAASGGDRFERESDAFHDRLRRGFLDLATREPARFRIVESGRAIASVAEDVWSAVATRFAAALDGG
ncbi:MAG: dTMP kinase [Lentisphaerae bacterium]|nr:dTMP kinase [Lentisphaerota bacterium]